MSVYGFAFQSQRLHVKQCVQGSLIFMREIVVVLFHTYSEGTFIKDSCYLLCFETRLTKESENFKENADLK